MSEGPGGKYSDGIISRYINRKISTRISKIILDKNLDVNPTHITVLNTLFGLLSFPLFINGYLLIGGIVSQLTSIFDGIDGELARSMGKVSKIGGFIDSIMDRFVDLSILFGLIYYFISYSGFNSSIHYSVFLLTLSGWILVSYIHARIEIVKIIEDVIISKVPPFASRDTRIFLIFLGSVLGHIYEFFVFTMFLCFFYIGIKFFEVGILFSRRKKLADG